MSEKAVKQNEKQKGGWYYKLELSKKAAIWGWIFLLPWLLGFLMFLFRPLVETIRYAFSTVRVLAEGGTEVTFIGWENFKWAFTVDTTFTPLLTDMLWSVVFVLVVIVFSLIVAVLLNGKYRGRSAARAIFFVPIIMGTQIATAALPGNDALSQELAGGEELVQFGVGFLQNLLYDVGFNAAMVGYITGAVNNIFTILAITGVPILILLAGLQSISPALYEVAKIEGATGYEAFWKVTLPMVSPMLMLCTIYSVVDAFLRHKITDRMYAVAITDANYGLGAAMTSVYMLVCFAVIGLITFILSRVVFYYD